jgi:hypothetical protein
MRLGDYEWDTESKTEMQQHKESSKDFASELTF